MWGVKLNSGYRNLWNKTTGDLVRAGKVAGEKKKDQESLAGIVWPLAQRKGSRPNFVTQCLKQSWSLFSPFRDAARQLLLWVGGVFVDWRHAALSHLQKHHQRDELRRLQTHRRPQPRSPPMPGCMQSYARVHFLLMALGIAQKSAKSNALDFYLLYFHSEIVTSVSTSKIFFYFKEVNQEKKALIYYTTLKQLDNHHSFIAKISISVWKMGSDSSKVQHLI